MTDPALYERLLRYNFDEGYKPDPGYTFAEKVMRVNNWTADYTRDVIHEYKNFMYLVIARGGGAPSDPIDQVWHQHILYTKDYKRFCDLYAGRFINHSPDRKIGNSSKAYDSISVAYLQEFKERPGEIWALQSIDYKRVDLSNNYLVPVDSMATIIKIFFITLKSKFKW